jgi:hypothetical protein
MAVKLRHAHAEGRLRAFYNRMLRRIFVLRNDYGIEGRK